MSALARSRTSTEHRRKADERDRHRVIADFIAGMTDRYAIKEHRRLFSVDES